jgi:hypothetical protein
MKQVASMNQDELIKATCERCADGLELWRHTSKRTGDVNWLHGYERAEITEGVSLTRLYLSAEPCAAAHLHEAKRT